MLTQDHDLRFPDWYGVTTLPGADACRASSSRPAGGRLAKYARNFGEGRSRFSAGTTPKTSLRGRDPATDLTEHPRSPGYRLILNNVLFPAAEKKERKT
jgi:hypothetical protein